MLAACDIRQVSLAHIFVDEYPAGFKSHDAIVHPPIHCLFVFGAIRRPYLRLPRLTHTNNRNRSPRAGGHKVSFSASRVTTSRPSYQRVRDIVLEHRIIGVDVSNASGSISIKRSISLSGRLSAAHPEPKTNKGAWVTPRSRKGGSFCRRRLDLLPVHVQYSHGIAEFHSWVVLPPNPNSFRRDTCRSCAPCACVVARWRKSRQNRADNTIRYRMILADISLRPRTALLSYFRTLPAFPPHRHGATIVAMCVLPSLAEYWSAYSANTRMPSSAIRCAIAPTLLTYSLGYVTTKTGQIAAQRREGHEKANCRIYWSHLRLSSSAGGRRSSPGWEPDRRPLT